MKLADRIRDHAYHVLIAPRLAEGQPEVVFRARDVHSSMNLMNRIPAVCDALRAGVFSSKYNLRRTRDPEAGHRPNVTFGFGRNSAANPIDAERQRRLRLWNDTESVASL